jgi:Tol biopolymer transport system component
VVCIEDILSCFTPWIAYEVSVGGLTQVEFIKADGSELIEYDSGGAIIEMAPAWSPSGTQLATVVIYDGILTLQTTNYLSGVVTTYINELESVITPAWSLDESRIVLAGRPEDVSENSIYRIDLTNGATTQLTEPSGDDADATPVFNSDGSRIYYQHRDGSFFSGFWDIYIMNTNGAGVEQISDGAQVSGRFALDPTSSFIVYPNLYYDTDGMSLFRLDLSDGESALIGEAASTYNDPSFFPDGLFLAVTVDGLTPAGSTTKNIAVIQSSTGELLSVINETVNSNSRPAVNSLDSSEISLSGMPLTFEEIIAP